MFNILTPSKTDPTTEFNGLWHNESTGALWVWARKPVLVGFSKDGKMLGVDFFEATFNYTQRRNEIVDCIAYDYGKIPVVMIAEVSGDDEALVEIHLGSLYGTVDLDDKFVIVGQQGNVGIGSELSFKCETRTGTVTVKLTVISYE